MKYIQMALRLEWHVDFVHGGNVVKIATKSLCSWTMQKIITEITIYLLKKCYACQTSCCKIIVIT